MASDSVQLSDQFLVQSALYSETPKKISSSKRLVSVIDGNQGSYTSGLITIDATNQLNGSKGFASLHDGYLTIPYVVTLQNTGAGATATAATRLCVAPKCGVWNIVDSMSVELNGKQVISEGDFKLYLNNIRAMTEWGLDEINSHGADSFCYPDDWSSIGWSNNNGAAVASYAGDGYLANAMNPISILSTTSNNPSLPQNDGLIKRALANPPPVAVQYGSFGWPTLSQTASPTMALQGGKGAFVAGASGAAGVVMGTWYYMHKIRLVDLHPLFKEIDLLANPQLKIRLRMNVGYSDIALTGGASPVFALSSTTMTSGQTVPVMLAAASSGSPMASVLSTSSTTTTLRLAFGPLVNNITNTIASSGTYFPYTTCRLNIPFYDIVDPRPIISKPVKTIRYLDSYAQYFKSRAGTGIQSGQQNVSFNFQLSASLKNVKYIALIPFAETSANHWVNSSANNTEQFQSPFDSAPWTHQPGSAIRNFQVQIGNTNVFPKSHEYDYENFMDEFSKLNAINGDLSHSLANGLIDMKKWATVQRVLIADCSRFTDHDVPQSIQVLGVNSACQGTNLLVLVVYERSLDLDLLTGECSRAD